MAATTAASLPGDTRYLYWNLRVIPVTKPGDLPAKQPMKFEFIINLKAAETDRLTIPPNVLVRADRVIR